MGIPDEELVPAPPYTPPPAYVNLPVCIIGAGVAGLYTAMMLDFLGIKYEILEASERHGGRLYTHHFNKLDGPYQYFVSSLRSRAVGFTTDIVTGCRSHAFPRYRYHETSVRFSA
jgi:cation diffusion facilitator CzcD-associated flavoprotein CzcO